MPNEPTEPIVKYAPPMPAISPARMTFRYRVGDHPDADRVGRHRVLADRPGAQAPAGPGEPDLHPGEHDVRDVQEDGRVEEDRPDDRDVAQQRDLHQVEGVGVVQRVAVLPGHQRVVQVAGEAENQRVEHDAEHDLVDPVGDREQREQDGDQRPGRRPAQQPQPQRPGDRRRDRRAERAEQQLALDRDVDDARGGADHAGQRAEHDRDRVVQRARQQVHDVERDRLAAVGPGQQRDDEQEEHRPRRSPAARPAPGG